MLSASIKANAALLYMTFIHFLTVTLLLIQYLGKIQATTEGQGTINSLKCIY
ncbi:hypothetical protein NIES37_05110 [Tolypothrix tenuis PCC 7101]|uniref:Uncharacterized protein n=1 Tax=Tolypothrix tenuis PCC 7101 TaxID=231146 RepID=A0A1Z4MSZ0_9CYAN|nr:hypothetical protein NIES37_05110 [Tolypothrix tenuis PCC 7101]BAZ72916.1 hypothetical protein NIES50_14730 [Aulosira laxa NIES-50]